MPVRELRPPGASRQLGFYQLLLVARDQWLGDALAAALRSADPDRVKREAAAIVPRRAQQVLAAAGIRDEHVFPLPAVLEARPSLAGYYRLLLGAPQKSFYAGPAGLGRFKGLEIRGVQGAVTAADLRRFCEAMAEPLAELVGQAAATLRPRDVGELQVLTLGAQFQGANNNKIGARATGDVFAAVAELAGGSAARSRSAVVLKNAAGREVRIELGADPDISIRESDARGGFADKVAIEIKGGTDRSNAHNRAGEAEKSHQKARNKGFRDFWTVIATQGLDLGQLRAESPTTRSWFDVAEILSRTGPDWDSFRSQLARALGISVGQATGRRRRSR